MKICCYYKNSVMLVFVLKPSGFWKSSHTSEMEALLHREGSKGFNLRPDLGDSSQ